MNVVESDLSRRVRELTAELEDMRLLYEMAIDHGEAVESQLEDANTELRLTQARLDNELADAAQYIQALMPERRHTLPQIDWCYEASSELSGDTLGYFEVDETKVAFYVIDVCGHGVGAALLSASVANQMRAWPTELADPSNPSELLAALNRIYPMERHGERFFTIWYGIHDAAAGVLRYASAGAPPALLLSRGESRLLGKPALPIGCMEGLRVVTQCEPVQAGDRLLVFSDGVYEVDDDVGGQLGLAQFCQEAATCDDPGALLSFVRKRSAAVRLPDDFTLMRVQF